jgi:hypothetical protein
MKYKFWLELPRSLINILQLEETEEEEKTSHMLDHFKNVNKYILF